MLLTKKQLNTISKNIYSFTCYYKAERVNKISRKSHETQILDRHIHFWN